MKTLKKKLKKNTAATFKTVLVWESGYGHVEVKVDNDAAVDISTRSIAPQHVSGKMTLAHTHEGTRSVAELLYGVMYKHARHNSSDVYDLRKQAYTISARSWG